MKMSMLQKIIDEGIKLTPMMQQYAEIKMQHPDTLLLFRMGDFYEVFFDDAKSASQILGIALTHRGKLGPYPIPMAGIPYHAASTYIDRITARGLKAVICEQMEDPKQAQGIVKRGISQVVSPGMPFDLEKTSSQDSRYMASACVDNSGKYFYLVLLDFTNGDFTGIAVDSEEELIDKCASYAPKEFITYSNQWQNHPRFEEYLKSSEHILKTYLAPDYFNIRYNALYVEKLIPSYTRDSIIKQHDSILGAVAALGYYVSSTQLLDDFFHIRPFRIQSSKNALRVGNATLKGFEIIPKHRDAYNESLLGFFDKTKTAMGQREIKQHFLSPIADEKILNDRFDFISTLLKNPETLHQIRQDLSGMRDIERVLAKTTTKKINVSDLLNLALTIELSQKMITLLPADSWKHQVFQDVNISNVLSKKLNEIKENIQKTINDELGASAEHGNLVKDGVNKQRDRLKRLSENSSNEVLSLETRYREETGISNLKIKYNNVSGFFIEVSKSHTKKVPEKFERKQTLVNAERYSTEELNEFEKEIISAKEKLKNLEQEIFNSIVSELILLSPELIMLARFLARLDIYQSLAMVALEENLVRPTISSNQKLLRIKGAYHPLIKQTLHEQFVSHDLELDESCHFALITGPNMAGKTTVMREMAIIQFLAQIGSFVPAKSAELGLKDYLFGRLGASDDILKGHSTFMVEMSETSEILRHATGNSLIIMDEVGRGTSTYDGLSIAWALVEHFITQTKAITLFSTHYHELIDVVGQHKEAQNFTMEVLEDNGHIQFLYRLIPQGAGQSYGIHVARLAGLPQTVITRSYEILKTLEHQQNNAQTATPNNDQGEEKGKANKRPPVQLSFFSEQELRSKGQETQIPSYLKDLENSLKLLDIMNLTPLKALEKLLELQNKIKNPEQKKDKETRSVTH